jgi:hypothetical protein
MKKVELSFEDCYEVIHREILKRKSKWTLTAIASIEFADIVQIILLHIWKKWPLYDQTKPLLPWLSVIIMNQIRNLVRNNYTNFSRPCLRCQAAIDQEGCRIYGEQCNTCPLYEYWTRNKQSATHIKLALPIENHTDEVYKMPDNNTGDIENGEEKLRVIMKKILKPMEYKVYYQLYVLHQSEEMTGKNLGFISNENHRKPGYRRLYTLIQEVKEKARKYISEFGIE